MGMPILFRGGSNTMESNDKILDKEDGEVVFDGGELQAMIADLKAKGLWDDDDEKAYNNIEDELEKE